MRVRLLLFAGARERAHASELTLELPSAARARDVIAAAVAAAPALEAISSSLRVAVNHAFVAEDAAIVEGDELALLPPVSGGAGRLLRVIEEPIDLARLVAAVEDDRHGAIATFSGVVRDHSDGKRVHRLDYEAYTPMAERMLVTLADEIEARYPSVRLAIAHRVGSLAVGDIAVVVATGAPHRREALQACAEAIDTLKATVPIWKREHTDEGAVWVGCDGCLRHEHRHHAG